MRAKAAIVTVFALVLAAAAICGEQYRLGMESAVQDNAASTRMKIAAREVDVTN
jgi:hypothetical protein